jgi:hypothetical protein
MPPIKGSRKSDVTYWRAQFRPHANCVGSRKPTPVADDEDLYTGCSFSYPYDGMFFPPDWRQIRQAAKNHAYENPGHIVLVDVIDRTEYQLKPEDFQSDDSSDNR